MILQVLANPRQILDNLDSKSPECVRIANSYEHQKLRASD